MEKQLTSHATHPLQNIEAKDLSPWAGMLLVVLALATGWGIYKGGDSGMGLLLDYAAQHKINGE